MARTFKESLLEEAEERRKKRQETYLQMLKDQQQFRSEYNDAGTFWRRRIATTAAVGSAAVAAALASTAINAEMNQSAIISWARYFGFIALINGIYPLFAYFAEWSKMRYHIYLVAYTRNLAPDGTKQITPPFKARDRFIYLIAKYTESAALWMGSASFVVAFVLLLQNGDRVVL
jgi:hypothetical protein